MTKEEFLNFAMTLLSAKGEIINNYKGMIQAGLRPIESEKVLKGCMPRNMWPVIKLWIDEENVKNPPVQSE
jgi:hypothetical protein